VDALSDAKTTLPASGRFSRTFEKLNAGLFFLALAIFQVENIIASRQLYIVFRPDFIPVNGTVDPDASYVVDSAQALVDLQVSFVLEKLVGFFMLVYRAHPEQFQIVAAPVCRGSNGGGGGGGGGGGELAAAHPRFEELLREHGSQVGAAPAAARPKHVVVSVVKAGAGDAAATTRRLPSSTSVGDLKRLLQRVTGARADKQQLAVRRGAHVVPVDDGESLFDVWERTRGGGEARDAHVPSLDMVLALRVACS